MTVTRTQALSLGGVRMSGIATPGFAINYSPSLSSFRLWFVDWVPELLLFDLEPLVDSSRARWMTQPQEVIYELGRAVETQLRVWAYRGELYQEMTATGYLWRYRLRGRPFPRSWVDDVLGHASTTRDALPAWMRRPEIG